MRPVLFYVWQRPIYAWGVMLALAFIVGILISVPQGRRKGLKVEHIIDLGLYGAVAGLIGARLVYVLLDLGRYLENPISILYLRDGGLSFHGGLAFGIIAGYLYCKAAKIDPGVAADIAAPAVALGYAIVRVGCLLNGCCYGIESNVPWAIEAAGDGVLRHPTQIYSSIAGLVIFLILWPKRNHKKFPGYLMFLFVGLYSIARFVIEIWRESPRNYFGPLSLAQVASIILGIAAFGMIYVLESGRKNAQGDSSEAEACAASEGDGLAVCAGCTETTSAGSSAADTPEDNSSQGEAGSNGSEGTRQD